MRALFKHAYLQPWGTYRYDTAVIVGMNKAETINAIRRLTKDSRIWRETVKEIEEDTELDKCLSDNRGLFSWYENGTSVLWLKTWKSGWEYLDVLNHEVDHAIYYWCRHISIQDEAEAQAYQHEYLHREMRTHLAAALQRAAR
jgi:hypothetical protein